MEPRKALNSQSTREKNQARGVMLSALKLYCKAIVIKTVWHKNGHTDQ